MLFFQKDISKDQKKLVRFEGGGGGGGPGGGYKFLFHWHCSLKFNYLLDITVFVDFYPFLSFISFIF
jgi:hypothetical protein